MAKFTDMVSSVGVGEDGVTIAYPDNFIADLTAAYDDDMSIPTAKIEVLMAENAALAQENTLLKAHNYELIVQNPSTDDGGSDDGSDDSDDGDDTDDDVTTNDLFESKE